MKYYKVNIINKKSNPVKNPTCQKKKKKKKKNSSRGFPGYFFFTIFFFKKERWMQMAAHHIQQRSLFNYVSSIWLHLTFNFCVAEKL